MSKEGRKDYKRMDIAGLRGAGTRPICPGIRADGKGWRAEGEQVENHRFIIATPVIGEKSRLRRPTMADSCRAHLHPRPVDAAVEVVGQGTDLGFCGVMLIE